MNHQTVRLLPIKSVILIWIILLCLTVPAGLSHLKAAEVTGTTANPEQEKWKAGIATTVITPAQPMWMSGYAARTKPSEGKVHDLHAKALALEDNQGTRFVIVTVDLLGVSRSLRDWLEKQVHERYKYPLSYCC